MELHLTAVRGADLGVARRMGDAEDFVRIGHRHCLPIVVVMTARDARRPGDRLAQTFGPAAVAVPGPGAVGAVCVVGGIGAVCVPGGTVLVPGDVAVPL
jgi:hypothetical protein